MCVKSCPLFTATSSRESERVLGRVLDLDQLELPVSVDVPTGRTLLDSAGRIEDTGSPLGTSSQSDVIYPPFLSRLNKFYLPFCSRLNNIYLPFCSRLNEIYPPFCSRLNEIYLPYFLD